MSSLLLTSQKGHFLNLKQTGRSRHSLKWKSSFFMMLSLVSIILTGIVHAHAAETSTSNELILRMPPASCDGCTSTGTFLNSYQSTTVDGDYAEWNLINDFWSGMYEAGNSTKTYFDDCYVRYNSADSTVYVLVLDHNLADAYPILSDAGNASNSWAAIDAINNKVYSGNSGDNGAPPDFAWIGVGYDGNSSHAKGYEASFHLAPDGGINHCFIIHTEQSKNGGGATAGTESFSGPGKCIAIIQTADAPLDAVCTPTNANCFGENTGSACVTPSGGKSPYTYLWNNGAATSCISNLAAATYTVTVTDNNGATVTRSSTVSQPSSAVGISMSKTDVTITNGSDGTATANPSGGTPGYTYLWSNSQTTQTASGLVSGTYTVTVTDSHGCSAGASITVNQPDCNIDMSGVVLNVTCNGLLNGSIDVNVTGKQGNVSYLWNDGATTQDRTGLVAGAYTVTATDQGNCSVTKGFTVSEPSVLGMSGVVTEVTITGGSNGAINVTVTGGTTPYTYLWNDGATTEDRSNLTAGTYTVTVTDHNGCPAQQSFTIHQPGCTIDLSGVVTNAACHGSLNGSIDVTVTGAQGSLSYLWNDGAITQDRSGLSAAAYTVTASDQGNCSVTKSFTVSEPDELSVSETHVNVTVSGGNNASINVTVSGGTGPYTYLWNDGVTTEDRSGLTALTYTVTVTDHNGCSKVKTIIISQPGCVCTAPTQFTVDSLSASAAQVCWNAIPCATGYVLQWKNSIKTKWQVINVPTGSSCTIFTNQYSDSYDIKVAAICQDGSPTAYSSVFVFHTYPSCLKPTAPYTSTIKSAQASAHWTRATDATSQVIKYRKVGTTAFTSKTLSATATSYTIKNLLANTSYEWQVKSTCTGFGKTATSDFTALQQFKTTSQKLAGESIASNMVSMKLYPNPASRVLTIAMQFENVSDQSCIIRVSSMVGQIVEEKTAFVSGNSLTENLTLQNGIASGIYMVTVIVDGNAYHQQLVVSKD